MDPPAVMWPPPPSVKLSMRGWRMRTNGGEKGKEVGKLQGDREQSATRAGGGAYAQERRSCTGSQPAPS